MQILEPTTYERYERQARTRFLESEAKVADMKSKIAALNSSRRNRGIGCFTHDVGTNFEWEGIGSVIKKIRHSFDVTYSRTQNDEDYLASLRESRVHKFVMHSEMMDSDIASKEALHERMLEEEMETLEEGVEDSREKRQKLEQEFEDTVRGMVTETVLAIFGGEDEAVSSGDVASCLMCHEPLILPNGSFYSRNCGHRLCATCGDQTCKEMPGFGQWNFRCPVCKSNTGGWHLIR